MLEKHRFRTKVREKLNMFQQVEFAVSATQKACKDKQWLHWASSWLDKSDKSCLSAINAHLAVEKAYHALGEIEILDPDGSSSEQALQLVAKAATYSSYAAYLLAGFSENAIEFENPELEFDKEIGSIVWRITDQLECVGRLTGQPLPLGRLFEQASEVSASWINARSTMIK